MQLGKVTYQCFLNQKESEEIAALSSYIQQRLATVAELSADPTAQTRRRRTGFP
ncbi:MAG: hypothetical protein ACLSA6_16960 [Holdemania massiliensis]